MCKKEELIRGFTWENAYNTNTGVRDFTWENAYTSTGVRDIQHMTTITNSYFILRITVFYASKDTFDSIQWT